ncbi:MAG: aspartate-semialdehyde dehydrogenase [Dehalococcoidia bacterium]|nr:aspartate-semialdehyde dehydrogenase [Dehalococcoidia bacterium]
MAGLNVVVVGATGAVGTVFLKVLEQRKFPVMDLKLVASPRSVGKRIRVRGKEYTVEALGPDTFKGADIAFVSADGSISKVACPQAAQAGAVAIDDSSVFRMETDVPLVVPEVNDDDLERHKGIVSIPNCTTTPLAMTLHALRQGAEIKRVTVATYQAVSGTGRAAMDELTEQSRAALDGREHPPKAYPHPIAFNLLPQVDSFLDNGYTREEWKMVQETRKILHLPDLPISSTCVRVPVQVCHSEAVHVEFDRPMTAAEARELLSRMPGVKVLDRPEQSEYPMPLQAAGTDETWVGRIRQDASHPNGLAFWVVSDNLRKGAALNAIQIAEEMQRRELLPAGRSQARSSQKNTEAGRQPAKAHAQANSTFEEDFRWYKAHKSELLLKYGGVYVAIIGGRVVDSDPDFGKLAPRVFAKYGHRDTLMPHVTREDRTIEMPSLITVIPAQ